VARLAGAGARVFALDRPERPAPAGAMLLPCDLSRSDQVDAAVARVDAEAGRLDVVVHAAGVSRDARIGKLGDADWETVLSTNLDSAFYLLRAVVPLLRRAGGAVVLVSSINGERGKIGLAAYAASKGGMNALARTAARELGGFGVRVNVVAPGWIESPLTASAPPSARERALDETELRRLGEPDDVARVVWFLASPMAGHITGQVLRVDGGQLIG
jgi:NAD(P)-dependent dehydrogenase (short-subunit alcohol dehydrogenase family)